MRNQEFIPSQSTLQFSRQSLNKTISDEDIVLDTLSVDLGNRLKFSNYVIQDVNITIEEVLHTRDSDLIFVLKHTGVSDTLILQAGGNGENFISTRLDDQATIPIAGGSAPFSGSFQPEYPLEQFNGFDPDGQWILEIADVASGNSGILQAWELELTFGPPTGINDKSPESGAPMAFRLGQNYPNPFNPTTTIQYYLPTTEKVTLKVYNVLGQEVVTLVNEWQQAGSYNVRFDARNLASGVYLYRIQASGFVKTRKMLLIR